jgi:hypothetical protein
VGWTIQKGLQMLPRYNLLLCHDAQSMIARREDHTLKPCASELCLTDACTSPSYHRAPSSLGRGQIIGPLYHTRHCFRLLTPSLHASTPPGSPLLSRGIPASHCPKRQAGALR